MNNKQAKSLRISTIGMSPQAISALRMFFRGPCMDSYILTDDNLADISIIDMDTYNAKQAWKNHRQKYPGRPAILESINETYTDDAVFVRKPVNSDVLVHALEEIRKQLLEPVQEKKAVTRKKKASLSVKPIKTVKKFEKLTVKDEPVEPMLTSQFLSQTTLPQTISHKQAKSRTQSTNNVDQPASGETIKRRKKPASSIDNNIDSNIDNYTAINVENINVKEKIKIVNNDDTTDQPVLKKPFSTKGITKNAGVIFNKLKGIYTSEENIKDTDKVNEFSIPVLDSGFHLKDHLPTVKNDTTDPSPFMPVIEKSVENNTEKKLNLDVESRSDTENSHPETSEISETSGMFYVPGNFLQGYLEKAFNLAHENKKNVLLEGLLQSIVILHESREVFIRRNEKSVYAMSERSLFAISGVPLTQENVATTILDESYNEICNQEGLLIDYDLLLWKLTIRASRGRVPEGTDLSRQMCLEQLPNIPRLVLTPHARKIATLWSEEPSTLSMTAQTLKVPQREVFTFFSAARALDLIEYSYVYEEPEFQIGGMNAHLRKQATQKESIFGKIVSKIRSLPGIKNEFDADLN